MADTFWNRDTPGVTSGQRGTATLAARVPGAFGDTFAQIPLQSLLLEAALQATAVVTEAISAGSFVNIYNNAGTLSVRNAIATDISTSANGFVQTSYIAGQTAVINMLGINAGVTVTSDAVAGVYLSDTVPGGFTTTAPTATGHISQSLGQAMPGLGIFFTINPAYPQ